jgi:hypothetical protein
MKDDFVIILLYEGRLCDPSCYVLSPEDIPGVYFKLTDRYDAYDRGREAAARAARGAGAGAAMAIGCLPHTHT